MLEIYLIRHGVTPWNLEKRFQGQTDIPLSDEGVEQAKATRDRLKETHFDAMYSSGLLRARRTAEIIAEPHGLQVIPIEGLREICMGDWEGLTWDEINAQYPEILKVWKTHPTQAKVPNFEGVIPTSQRTFKAFASLAEKHKNDQRILIVAHGMVNSTILTMIQGGDLDNWYSLHQGNTAVNIIEYDGHSFSPTLLNCTKHCDSIKDVAK